VTSPMATTVQPLCSPCGDGANGQELAAHILIED